MSRGRVAFRLFRGTFASWHRLLAEAAAFADALPDGALISISHSAEPLEGLVVVWYYTDEPAAPSTPGRPLDY